MQANFELLPRDQWELSVKKGLLVASILRNPETNSVHHVGIKLAPNNSPDELGVIQDLEGILFSIDKVDMPAIG